MIMNRTLEQSIWAIFAALTALAVWAAARGPGWGYPGRDPVWLSIYVLVAVLLIVHATWAMGAKRAALLMSMPGIGHYSAMLILSRSAISPGSQHLSSSALW